MCARALHIHVFLWLNFCFILQQIYDDAPTKVQMLLDTGKIELVLECKEHVDGDSSEEDLSVNKHGFERQQRMPGEGLFLAL